MIYIEIDEKLIKTIQDITLTDYDFVDKKIPVENLINIIEDLLCEFHNLQEKIEDLENDCEIKRANPYEEYGISERDFF